MEISVIDQFTAGIFPHTDVVVRPFTEPLRFKIQALIKSDRRLSTPQEFLLEETKIEIKYAIQNGKMY